jgi:phage terminase large subunit
MPKKRNEIKGDVDVSKASTRLPDLGPGLSERATMVAEPAGHLSGSPEAPRGAIGTAGAGVSGGNPFSFEAMFGPLPPDPLDREVPDIPPELIEKPKAPERVTDNPLLLFVERYRDDPVGFVRDILHAEPMEWQERFLKAVAKGERRISIRAGHGVGKSTACSWAILHHMLTRFPQKTVCTAPTASQLFDALFAELKRWVNELPDFLRSLIEVKSDRLELLGAPEASFVSARTSSADKPEALAGVHSEHVLLVVDEASAVPEKVFEAASGSMSGGSACTILIGNPTRNSGLFFRTHHGLKDDWFTMHVNSEEIPLVSKDFIRQIENTYGRESNAYRVRVLGEFALRDDDVLIPADLVDAAMVRDIVEDPYAPLVYGLDVARFGDDRSVLCIRKGSVVRQFYKWSGLDLMSLVGAVVAHAQVDKPSEIVVDSIGLGAGVADRLRELGYNVRDVNVAESAAFNPQAMRLRDDLWLQARDFLRARACRLPKDDDLRMELVSPTYKFTSNGKIQVEGKDSLKKRGLRSPDLADAFCLTFASVSAGIGGRASTWLPGVPLKRSLKGIV